MRCIYHGHGKHFVSWNIFKGHSSSSTITPLSTNHIWFLINSTHYLCNTCIVCQMIRSVISPQYVCVTLRGVYSDTTQLDVELSSVQLSCVAIDTLSDATQLSPAIGNATDPVAAYSQSARSRSVELSCRYRHFADATQLDVKLCRYKRAFNQYIVNNNNNKWSGNDNKLTIKFI